MPFDQAFALSSVLLATMAFSGLVLAQSVPFWLALPMVIILMISALHAGGVHFIRRAIARVTVSPTMWNILLIGAFALLLIDLTVVSRDLLPAGIHFLVVLLAVKLLTLQQRRDYRHLYAISLMAILASAALTSDAWYVPIFLLYLITAVWTLLLYHMTQETGDTAVGHQTIPIRITRHFFWLTNGTVVLAIALTLAIFFLIPRMGAGVLQKTSGEALRATGFSDRVDLGTIGAVKQDPQIVMRVELPDQPAVDKDRLYLRGLAYDQYNGQSWTHSGTRRRSLSLVAEGTFLVRPAGSRSSNSLSGSVRQDIMLETLDTAVLFAAPFAELVSGEFLEMQADAMGGLRLRASPASRIRYSVISQAPQLAADERMASALDYPDAILAHYLQVPMASQHVADLARRVSIEATTPFERTLAIQQHLLKNYSYSLEADTATLSHPLDEFLFTRKTGYCEHYATAMVVMLRTVGIPARLVTGFLATEWNEYGGYFTVRQRDAHAWVEVYFPHSGWITMDPTPTVSTAISTSRWAPLTRFGESVRLQWDRLFVRYSVKDQLAVVHGVREGTDALRERVSRGVSLLSAPIGQTLSRLMHMVRTFHLGMLELITGVIVVGSALFLLMLRDRIALWATTHLPTSHPELAIVQLYARMLRMMERHGVRKSPAATASEFARLVEQEWKAAAPIVANVTALYHQGRFSQTPLTPGELSRAAEQVGQLQSLTHVVR
ncbi:MAG: Protein-glutamine gamma-glutamyltransferase [Nitrospira sp.]|nr:Protein-glutamine gamma-glutamyltransferase [Nitrospira sp.]